MDAVSGGIEIGQFVERVGRAGPHRPDQFLAGLILQGVEQPLPDGGEVGGVCRGVFFRDERRAGLGERGLEGGDAVPPERVVDRQSCDIDARRPDRERVGNRVLTGIAPGAKDVAVPFVAGDLVGDSGLDDQDFLVLFGDRQHGDRGGRRGGADGDVGAVVLVSFRERALGEVGLALVVLRDDDDLAPVDFHRPLGRVFEPEPEARFGLLGVRLERTGEAADQGDLQIVRGGGPGRSGERRGESECSETKAHGRSTLSRCREPAPVAARGLPAVLSRSTLSRGQA